MNDLSAKTLVMLVGPSCIGKSTLMNEVVRLNSEFGRVTGFTTRAPRPNDEPGQYRYYSNDEVEQKAAEGELVQSATSPTTGVIYGTEPQDYPAAYNLKDILANAVGDFRTLPFAQTVTISLTAPAEQWHGWFLSRYPEKSDEAIWRLEEAKLSINSSLDDPETYWLENPAEQIPETVAALINIVLDQPPKLSAPQEPRVMLELIEEGIWPRN